MLDERLFKENLLESSGKDFLNWIKSYDDSQVPIMKRRGYTCVHSMERTVAFTFGDVYKRQTIYHVQEGLKHVVQGELFEEDVG